MEEWKKPGLESGGLRPGSDLSVTMGCRGEPTAREEAPRGGARQVHYLAFNIWHKEGAGIPLHWPD